MKWFALVYPSAEARNRVINRLVGIDATVKEENGVFVVEDPSSNQIQL